MGTITTHSADPGESLLRHVVLFKFKSELSDAKVQEVVDAFRALPKKIDAIADFEYGTDVSVENKSAGFTHCFVVTFRSEEARDRYLPHPAHQEFVELVGPRLDNVLVVDYWTKDRRMSFSERIALAKEGDREVIEALLGEWRPWLRRQARGLIFHSAAARVDSSDVVQNTLVTAFQDIAKFRGTTRAEFSGWLRGILRLHAARMRRYHDADCRHASQDCHTWRMHELPPPTNGQPVNGERSRHLQSALQSLPEPLLQVVVGRVFHEQSFTRLADQLGRSPRVVRRQWTEALRHLAHAIRDLTDSPDSQA